MKRVHFDPPTDASGLTQVDLFSGVGGMLLAGARAGFWPAIACEIQPFCLSVLGSRFPLLPIVEDVHDVSVKSKGVYGWRKGQRKKVDLEILGNPTVLTASFPFQANYSRGAERRGDPRSLWNEAVRIVGELHPTWVLVETLPRIATLGLDDASWDLERAGYSVTAFHLPAQAFDCPLRKDRLFIVGALDSDSRLLDSGASPGFPDERHPWPAPGPELHRVAERLPNGVDWHVAALHALGDATVPGVAEVLLRGIADTERELKKQRIG